jgi:transmembrane sensor
MEKDQFLLLVTKVLSGNASPEETDHLKEIISRDSSLKLLYDQYTRYWHPENLHQQTDVEKALSQTWEKINQSNDSAEFEPAGPEKKIFSWKRWAAAAALTGIAAMAWWMISSRSPLKPSYVESYNPKGERSTIVLPDGSKVWLGAESRLTYPAAFAGRQRTMELDGEAYFEVVKNPQKPFVIHMKAGTVRVLGTSFNVKAHTDDGEIITSVNTGKVAFVPLTNNSMDSIFLTPGRKAFYNVASGKITESETDAEADRAWTEGILYFQADSLGKITRTLERYYGKTIVFKNEQLKSYRYTGKFSHNSPAEILRFLSKTKPFYFQDGESSIIIGK